MSFLELAKARYSVRSFDSRPVEKEKLDLLLQAAQAAPSACNYQPVRILVVDKEEDLKKFTYMSRSVFGAPTVLIVCADTSVAWVRGFDKLNHAGADACIAATHIMLQAAELGLGTVWVGNFDPESLRKHFNIPENIAPICLLPLVYPSASSAPSERHTSRKPLDETVFYEHF
jgi:nitroreductase